MAVNVTLPYDRPRRDALLDWMQMLSGAALVLFLWCHTILLSSVLLSPALMDDIALFLEATSMAQVGGPLIFICFLGHFILAARKIPFTANGQEIAWAHAVTLRHRDTWLWIVQALTAMVILIMGAIHMWVVLGDLPISAHKSAMRVQSGGWLWFYVILLPVVQAHASVGAYRILVKWGYLTRENRRKGFLVIGAITLVIFALAVASLTLTQSHSPAPLAL